MEQSIKSVNVSKGPIRTHTCTGICLSTHECVHTHGNYGHLFTLSIILTSQECFKEL